MISMLSELRCPKCNSIEPDEKYIKDGAFICAHRNSENIMCGCIVGIYCKICNKVYNADGFGFRNGSYECKECGKIQWGYTEYKQDKEKLQKDMNSALNRYMKDIKFFDEIIKSKK